MTLVTNLKGFRFACCLKKNSKHLALVHHFLMFSTHLMFIVKERYLL